jgi:hypothetical protein
MIILALPVYISIQYHVLLAADTVELIIKISSQNTSLILLEI